MSNTVKNYLFLGLPKSGKTTYFALMAHHLQLEANITQKYKFRYLPTVVDDGEKQKFEYITSNFIEDCISRLQKQRWPKKTQDYECEYSFELVDKSRTVRIDYHDYPGEAFEEAFYATENTDFQSAANDIQDRIKKASGVFLTIDAEALFNEQDRLKFVRSVSGLFQWINYYKPKVKLAIIFTKLELFLPAKCDCEKILRERYGNIYANLPSNHKFFYAYPLGNIEIKDDGNTYPPQEITPKNLLEPVEWMINNEDRDWKRVVFWRISLWGGVMGWTMGANDGTIDRVIIVIIIGIIIGTILGVIALTDK